MGIALIRSGLKIGMMAGVGVRTETPSEFIMQGKQRIGSWDSHIYYLLLEDAYNIILLAPEKLSVSGLLRYGVQKGFQVKHLITQCAPLAVPLALVSYGGSTFYWGVLAGIYEADVLVSTMSDCLLKPARAGKATCQPVPVVRSCLRNQMRCFYSIIQSGFRFLGLCNFCCGKAAQLDEFRRYLETYCPDPRVVQDRIAIVVADESVSSSGAGESLQSLPSLNGSVYVE